MDKKVYVLAYNDKSEPDDEQITYLVDDDKKIAIRFYDDGCEGMTVGHVKNILDFLDIKYFECAYSEFPIKYEEYECLRL